MKTKIIIFLTLILISACNPIPEPNVPLPNQTPPIDAQAKLDLINFFVYLNHGRYEDAASLYGGPYEVLEGYNPEIDPMNKAALLQSGCEINGIMCLQLYSASLIQQPSENEFVLPQFRWNGIYIGSMLWCNGRRNAPNQTIRNSRLL